MSISANTTKTLYHVEQTLNTIKQTVTRRALLVEQGLLTIPEDFCGVRCCSIFLCIIVCLYMWLLHCLSFFYLRLLVTGYNFGIFQVFVTQHKIVIVCMISSLHRNTNGYNTT